MKIDRKIPVLFVPPILAAVVCLASSLILPHNSGYNAVQPEFLSSIDQLSLFTMEEHQDTPVRGIKDVFRHEWTLASAELAPYPDPPEVPPVRVTMIADSGLGKFCIINGKKMRPGDTTDSFRVTSIGKDHVILTYKNGTRENHDVKAY